MFLIQEKRKSGTYLCIVQSYRDPVTKKPKRKRIKNIGYLEELQKEYDDPVAYFTQMAKDMTREYNERIGRTNISLDLSSPMQAETFENNKSLGYIAISNIYHRLNIDTFFNNRQDTVGADYRMNQIMKLLVYCDLMYPGSFSYMYGKKSLFFDKMDFDMGDIEGFFKYLNQYRAQLRRWIRQRIRDNYNTPNEPVYYYSSNHYFEVDYQKWRDVKNDPTLHRPDPILQMGMFVDQNRIPITFELFHRNQFNIPMFNAALKRAETEYNIGRTIVIADNSTNDHRHLYGILSSGNGYIINQSIRSSEKKLQRYVLDDEGYVPIDDNRKVKSRIIKRKLSVLDENDKKKTVTITEKQIIMFDRKWSRWASATRESIIMTGRDLISARSSKDRSTSEDVHYLLDSATYDSRISGSSGSSHPLTMDESSLMQEEIFDGYYMFYTSETEMSDMDIIDAYSDIWEIEGFFKMKDSDYNARPESLSWIDHLSAQFTTDFVALVIMRILEKELDMPHRRRDIVNSLKKCNCILLENNIYVQTYYDSILESINERLGIDFTKRYRNITEIRSMLHACKKDPEKKEPAAVLL